MIRNKKGESTVPCLHKFIISRKNMYIYNYNLQQNLMGYEELDMTERLHFHFSLSCTAGGNGNPLQCSCLENPRDGGAWWTAVYGVAQSRTRLKRLSSSSSSIGIVISFLRSLTENFSKAADLQFEKDYQFCHE